MVLLKQHFLKCPNKNNGDLRFVSLELYQDLDQTILIFEFKVITEVVTRLSKSRVNIQQQFSRSNWLESLKLDFKLLGARIIIYFSLHTLLNFKWGIDFCATLYIVQLGSSIQHFGYYYWTSIKISMCLNWVWTTFNMKNSFQKNTTFENSVFSFQIRIEFFQRKYISVEFFEKKLFRLSFSPPPYNLCEESFWERFFNFFMVVFVGFTGHKWILI